MPSPNPDERSPRRDRQILLAVIGGIFAVVAAVGGAVAPALLKDGDKKGTGSSTPRPPSSTPRPPVTPRPANTRTAPPGLILLSPSSVHTRASSTLPPQEGNTYVAANTVDGDPQTAWSEGRNGPGIGASVTYTFGRPVDLQRVNIVNGYAKGDLFAKNLRIRAASVSTAQGVATAVLRDTDRYQRLGFQHGLTEFLRLEIDSVYGSRRYEDCLLSEIEFYKKQS